MTAGIVATIAGGLVAGAAASRLFAAPLARGGDDIEIKEIPR